MHAIKTEQRKGKYAMRIKTLPVAVLSGLVLLGACDDTFTVPDLNNPGLESLETNPTKSAVVDAVQGLMIGARAAISNQTGFVNHLGTLGRESLTFDNSDPRYFDEMLAGLLNAGNGAFGGSGWAPRYANIRNANIVLNSLDKVVGFTDAELEGIRGFAKTIQALDLLLVTVMRDNNGVVIDTNRPLDAELAPFVGRDQAYTFIVQLLDEARGHLNNAGSSFAFTLSNGFSGFDTPSSFAQFNRALAARVEVYRGNYAAALTALDQSFMDIGGDLDVGVFHSFGTGSGDVTNGLFQGADPQIVAHPTVRTDAPTKGDGSLDDRVARKTELLATPKSDPRGVTSNVRFTHYPTLSSPVPIIRNEELILLAAEARWFTGDQTGAMDALNDVRTRSGGLDPLAMPANDTEFIDALLNERRWSLLFEGGHRWIDMRRFNRLNELPRDRPSDLVPSAFPIPRNECIARNLNVPCGLGGG
ncbi:MAG: RagB/SusD family nutrient uptake outer membrane protein [Gemmatimonadetes bacterium]|nr:MAG: RagB/SusD family nutrient uptake outer membrane protein [Gemmatimonadota bacterium]